MFTRRCGFVLLLFVHMHRGEPLSLLAQMIIYAVIPNLCIFGVILHRLLFSHLVVFAWGCRMNIKYSGSGPLALFSSATHI